MSKRKRFSPEYKREIVDLVRRSKSSCRQVALEVGINPNMLTRWVREADSSGSKAFPGGGTPRDEEVARLKRELSRVTKERDFLRDAAAYFAKQSPNGTR
jgi:transposase